MNLVQTNSKAWMLLGCSSCSWHAERLGVFPSSPEFGSPRAKAHDATLRSSCPPGTAGGAQAAWERVMHVPSLLPSWCWKLLCAWASVNSRRSSPRWPHTSLLLSHRHDKANLSTRNFPRGSERRWEGVGFPRCGFRSRPVVGWTSPSPPRAAPLSAGRWWLWWWSAARAS